MSATNHNTTVNLKKLGIREIQERLEVSPIITDPGTFSVNADTGGKNYSCDLVISNPFGRF